jgi:hypothetical protein
MDRHILNTYIGIAGGTLAIVAPTLHEVNEWITTIGGTLSMIVAGYGVYRIFQRGVKK